MKKILVGMSGGVDSAVSAFLLKCKGYDVIGYTLKLTNDVNKCCNIETAKAVAKQIGIKHINIDIRDVFKKEIIHYFLENYKIGKTPNPCAKCNIIKFQKGLEFGLRYGSSLVASGHYAEIKNGYLYATDNVKDQAYFLSRLPKNLLEKIILPLSNFRKEDVRKIAGENNLVVAHIKDSQDVCFVKDDYRYFLEQSTISAKHGNIIDSCGNVLCKHEGIFNFTIGQRLRMGGMPDKLYINKIIPETNTVVVGKKESVYRQDFYVKDINYIKNQASLNDEKDEIYVKIRSTDYYHRVYISNIRENGFSVSGYDSFRAIAPGQLAVFYKRITDEKFMVLCSGWIEK